MTAGQWSTSAAADPRSASGLGILLVGPTHGRRQIPHLPDKRGRRAAGSKALLPPPASHLSPAAAARYRYRYPLPLPASPRYPLPVTRYTVTCYRYLRASKCDALTAISRADCIVESNAVR